MKFNFFKKHKEKEAVKVMVKEESNQLKEQFKELAKHSLALPITLYQL